MFSAALKHVMTGQSSLTVSGDPLLASNVLLLKTIGTNNATNASFIDSSSNNFTMSASGVVNQGSFSPYAPAGSWSAYFDGGVNNVYVASNANLQFGTGDFCAEGWFWRPSNSGLQTLFSIGGYTDGLMFRNEYFSFLGEAANLNSFLPTQKWFHAAVTRRLGVIYVFIDGLQVYSSSSATAAGNHAPTSATYIGGSSHTSGNENWTGYISGFRVVKGSSVYSGNFNPPTESLPATSGTSLLCLQYNRFVDFSNNGYALTVNGTVTISRFSPLALGWDSSLGGSASFSSSDSSRISTVNNDSFRFGTGDFCVEAWLYPSDTTPPQGIASIYGGWSFQLRAGAFQVWNSNGNLMVRSYTTKNSWVHVAWTRSGTSMRIFVNGVQQGAIVTDSTNFTGGGIDLTVGDLTSGIGFLYTGYMSDLRIVKGSAVYTSNFTPPTVPLTAITNTSLLLSFNNAAVYDATRSSNLTLNGTTQTSTAQKNYADTSVALSTASGNRGLQTVDRPELRFGTGDFTAELWWRPSGLSGYQTIINKGYNGTGGFALQTDFNSGRINVVLNGPVVITAPANRAVTDATWNHIALVRSAGTVTLWVNGLSAGSASSSADLSSTADLQIGWETQGGNQYPASGNIEDVRFSRTARYTAAFNPPTRALPVDIGVGPAFSGGTVTTSGNYTIHTFTSSGLFKVSGSQVRDVEYLVVGGGGGGAGWVGAGGGGGGFRTGTFTSLPAGTYTVTVGAGGLGGTANGAPGQGGDGMPSVFHTITAAGGGGGGGSTNGRPGGSGGGGSTYTQTPGSGNVPATTPSQGNNGGAGGAVNYGCGGGGGAGGVGGSVANSYAAAGVGGPGASSSISGVSTVYAGGGGGSGYYSLGANGGSGGGGNGGTGAGTSPTRYPTAGTDGLGGGGGGGATITGANGNGVGMPGGSGIVIVRYLT